MGVVKTENGGIGADGVTRVQAGPVVLVDIDKREAGCLVAAGIRRLGRVQLAMDRNLRPRLNIQKQDNAARCSNNGTKSHEPTRTPPVKLPLQTGFPHILKPSKDGKAVARQHNVPAYRRRAL